MSWHVTGEALSAYASGRIADSDAWSVEMHLTACERCRAALAAEAATDVDLSTAIRESWPGIAANLSSQGRVRRGSRSRELIVLIAAGPAARWAWFTAAVVVLALAAGLGAVTPFGRGQEIPLLGVVAPLLPILGVAASYGSGLDDAHEVIASTPGGGIRLLLLRSASVLAVTLPVGLIAGAVTGYGSPIPWLAASLALILTTLALASVTGVGRAAAIVGAAWVTGLAMSAAGDVTQAAPALLDPDAVPVWLLVSVAAVAVVALRRQAFNYTSLPAHPRLEN
ncbi:zf-HC2 domain-containing protein [Actinobacteria bacterium YIM 96077]|uniref:Anti-sigma factor n=1 Tax=Phytoactinopolyspora halophila TaxID=1981511 RepID=A0A329QU60_9ACTN|nr:zf-HC2 domain-containing protein [Phytoactinopolyspora halophila]AYY13902.1 zf-HC2 domain-containing protein [Actinobacteria bacterium YIM 96077]RAW15556.1 anti-sigma factor [Phytoactinopolyspora halophila]